MTKPKPHPHPETILAPPGPNQIQSLAGKLGPLPRPKSVTRSVRRGPFRPTELVSTRSRLMGSHASRYFRLADLCLLWGLGLFSAMVFGSGEVFNLTLAEILPALSYLYGFSSALVFFEVYGFSRANPFGKHILKLLAAAGFGAVLGQTLLLIVPSMASSDPQIADDLFFSTMMLSLPALILAHGFWYFKVKSWRKSGRLTPNVVIVGATKHATSLVKTALDRRDVNILGVFDDRLARAPEDVIGVPVLGDTQALMNHKILPFVDQIIVAIDPSAQKRVRQILDRLSSLPNEITILVDHDDPQALYAPIARLADAPLGKISRQISDEARAFAKRIQDIFVGSLALVLTAPIMLITAILIKLDDGGPVFFRQRRHGFNNEEILVWKFRSMRADRADQKGARQVSKDDDRVTKVGRFIRKTSIDELPQLFNVLCGEMSLVGPRPHPIGMKTQELESHQIISDYAHRHRMKPGMTGWAAIKGSRGALVTPEDVKRRVSLDVEYIDRQSFWFDLYIMTMTVPCLLGDTKTIR